MDVPLLVIAGASDDLAPPVSVEPAYRSSRSRDRMYKVYPQGHIDLIMGREATRTIWPTIADWIGARVAA
jgi:poly(3-hydroxyalkanoate) synthetase